MIYVVKKGDTLFDIAKAHTGDGNRYRELLPVNPQITDPNFIEIGDMVNIPASWSGGGTTNLPAITTPGTPAAEAGNMNNMLLIGAIVVVAAAGAYWYLGKTSSAQANPEEDDEGDEE